MAEILHMLITCYLADDAMVERHFGFVLDSITEHQLLAPNVLSETSLLHKWTTRLGSLSHSKSGGARWAAVCLFKTTAEQNHEIYLQNMGSWSTTLLTLLSRPEPTYIHEAVIDTLSFFFHKTSRKAEVQREITTIHVPRWNTCLLNLTGNQELMPSIFLALSNSVTNFPTTFRPVAENVQRLCIQYLDGSYSNNPELVCAATRCLSTINYAGGKATSGEQWASTISRLIATLHVTLDGLFDAINEETKVETEQEPFEMPSLSNDYIISFPAMLNRAITLISAISFYLSTSTSQVVQVPINKFLDLLLRMYNVHESSLRAEHKDKNKYTLLHSGLPTLHLHTNKLLASLLHCMDTYLIQHLRLLSTILLRLLNRSRDKRILRMSVYNLFTLSLIKYGAGFAELVAAPLLTTALEEVQVPASNVPTVVPVLPAVSTSKQSNKKRKPETIDLLEVSDLVSAQTFDLQTTALESIKQLVLANGATLSPIQRSSLDNLLVTRLFQLVQEAPSYTTENSSIEIKLYECLLASVLAPSDTTASVLPYAIAIFTSGLNSRSVQLQSLCSKALNICDLIIHSRLPPLQRQQSQPPSTVYVSGLSSITTELYNDLKDDDTEMVPAEHKDDMRPVPNGDMNGRNKLVISPDSTFASYLPSSASFSPNEAKSSFSTFTKKSPAEILMMAENKEVRNSDTKESELNLMHIQIQHVSPLSSAASITPEGSAAFSHKPPSSKQDQSDSDDDMGAIEIDVEGGPDDSDLENE